MKNLFQLSTLAALLLTACGPTIGDPCTTNAECLNQFCITNAAAPGGYCSQTCSMGEPNSCPIGSLCVRDALGINVNGCLRTCKTEKDCRETYLCKTQHDSSQPVCIGPAEL